jgi:hypothetical protein
MLQYSLKKAQVGKRVPLSLGYGTIEAAAAAPTLPRCSASRNIPRHIATFIVYKSASVFWDPMSSHKTSGNRNPRYVLPHKQHVA